MIWTILYYALIALVWALCILICAGMVWVTHWAKHDQQPPEG